MDIDEIDDISEEELRAKLDAKRYKDLIDILKKILNNLSAKSDSSAIEKLIETINNSKDDSIPSSIASIGETIVKKLDEIKNKKISWQHDVIRNNNGVITNVISKQV